MLPSEDRQSRRRRRAEPVGAGLGQLALGRACWSADHKLVQVLPAAYMFMILAWIGSLYNAYHDVHQLWDVYMQKHYRQKFFDSIAKRLARATVNKALKTGRKASVAGLDMRETDARTATQKLQASIIGESTQELEKHTRQEATMAYEMGVQDLRQPICICKYMCDTYVCGRACDIYM